MRHNLIITANVFAIAVSSASYANTDRIKHETWSLDNFTDEFGDKTRDRFIMSSARKPTALCRGRDCVVFVFQCISAPRFQQHARRWNRMFLVTKDHYPRSGAA